MPSVPHRKRKRHESVSSSGPTTKRRKHSPSDSSVATYIAVRDADITAILGNCRFSAASKKASLGRVAASTSTSVRGDYHVGMFNSVDCVKWNGPSEKKRPVFRCRNKDGTSMRLPPQLIIFFHFTLMGYLGIELAEALMVLVRAYHRSIKEGIPVDEQVTRSLATSLPLWLITLRRPKMQCCDRNNCVNYRHAC